MAARRARGAGADADGVEEVVRLIRQRRSRLSTCGTCSAEFETLRMTGRPPQRCEACDPSSTGWQRERTERPLRAAILALDDRVRELEVLLGAEGDEERARRFGVPSREALRRAVFQVAHAKGARPTADALLDLSAVARAWALRLTRPATDTERAA